MEHETKPYELFRSVTRMFAFGDEEWRYFVEMTSVKHVKRRTQLIKAGERVNYAYFCMEGLFRLYYTLEDGKEYNKSFSFENDFVTSYGAMITGEPSYFSVEALEDSTVIEISYRLLQELMERSHTWESLVRKAVEQLYLKKEERERHLLYFDATKRYQAFKDQFYRRSLRYRACSGKKVC